MFTVGCVLFIGHFEESLIFYSGRERWFHVEELLRSLLSLEKINLYNFILGRQGKNWNREFWAYLYQFKKLSFPPLW